MSNSNKINKEEKEWTVKILGYVTVFDETKEGAEDWVFKNIDAGLVEITAEDAESSEEGGHGRYHMDLYDSH